jgi:hypothetical protein
MKFLTSTECAVWAGERGLPTRDYYGRGHLRPVAEPAGLTRVEFKLPKDSGRKVWLARFLYSFLDPSPELLIWLGEWGVWSSSEHIPLVTRLRQALGEPRPLIEAPGHLVTPDEVDDGISLLVVALQFVWDCHVITASGRDVIFVSHDELGWFGSRDARLADLISGQLTEALARGAA